jgi:very-short-patch-repair endonuclease
MDFLRSQHLEQAHFAYDAERSKYFESQGYKVVRFWNNQVMNDVNRVIQAIEFALGGQYITPCKNKM